MSPELQSKIQHWRVNAANGNMTPEDMRAAIEALCADRVGASIASTTSRASKVKAVVPNASSMLDELDNL